MFSLPVRIYWEDTDAGGVVYHARYVVFLERARTEWMRTHGHGQELLRSEYGLVFAVRAMELDFLRPARLDDVLQVGVVLAECRRASAVFTQEIRRGDELVLGAQVRVAALDAGRFRPCAMPQPFFDHLSALVSNPPEQASS